MRQEQLRGDLSVAEIAGQQAQHPQLGHAQGLTRTLPVTERLMFTEHAFEAHCELLQDRSANLGDQPAGALQGVRSIRQVGPVHMDARESQKGVGMFEPLTAAAGERHRLFETLRAVADKHQDEAEPERHLRRLRPEHQHLQGCHHDGRELAVTSQLRRR